MFGEMQGQFEKKKERGANVIIDVKFIRHGERTKENQLTELGRDITRDRARESGITKESYDAVKAGGSNVDANQESGMGRAVETAHIYATEVAEGKNLSTRPMQKFSQALNYQNMVTPPPYNHREIYNSHLPENFDLLSDEENMKAAKVAQTATINYVLSLTGPEAEAWRKEAAGGYAYVLDHYIRQTKKLKSGLRVLRPEGSHGGTMEFLLKEALVREDRDGNKTLGFSSLDEIGGDIDPSESYTVRVATNEKSDLKELMVTFDDHPNRPKREKMYLDIDKVRELADFYKGLHRSEAI